MPRIKKHPNLPTKFNFSSATTQIPSEWGFKIGDRVIYKNESREGIVCGADDVAKYYSQLIVFYPDSSEDGVNGIGTFTGYYKHWRKID